MKKNFLSYVKDFWNFLWHDDSLLSNILLIIVLFVFVKFILYPFFGFLLATKYPIVSVVSGSMEHKTSYSPFTDSYVLCGKSFKDPFEVDFDTFWNYCGYWYENRGISKQQFYNFPFRDGFDKGDVMFLTGRGNIKVGDVIVFMSEGNIPIIHRVVNITSTSYGTFYTTKGDHNPDSIVSFTLNEKMIPEDKVIGKAFFRIPKVGYIKIWVSNLFKK